MPRLIAAQEDKMSLQTDITFLRKNTLPVSGEARAVEESWANVEKSTAHMIDLTEAEFQAAESAIRAALYDYQSGDSVFQEMHRARIAALRSALLKLMDTESFRTNSVL